MNRRSVLGGIAAGLAGLLSRPAKATQQTTPLYVFEPNVMPEDIEQHSPFRKEWLLSPKLFRYDFTDPYGRW